jgi:N-glycosylase/DNA lyase
MGELENILNFYKAKKDTIKSYIKSCEISSDACLFGELCFCIMTPQSRAKICREAVNRLKADNKLFTATQEELRLYTRGVRFNEKKILYIIEARSKLPELKKMLTSKPEILREWIIDNIKGLGMKESAHFMRNIGFKGLPIIDVHVQNFLVSIGRYSKKSESLTKKRYMELEKVFLDLSKELKLPPEELDIAIWLYRSQEKDFYG